MFDVFSSVKGLLKLDSVNIDNIIFRLHYKATVIILIAFSLVVTSRQYIGNPISCTSEGVPPNVMENYCWIHSSFTITDRLSTDEIGRDVSQPGVGPQQKGDQVKYHKYYQWVCFVLFFQAVLFHIPRFLWKTWEGDKTKTFVSDLNCPIINQEKKAEKKKLLIDYFAANLHNHNFYALEFFFCEVLNFVNVVVQFYFVNFFLGGDFMSYGSDVLTMTELKPENQVDPMAKIFPKVTKCTFHEIAISGTITPRDGLCVLPVNNLNEKMYVFLWFWFIVLAVVSGVGLLYRFAIVLSSQARLYRLRATASLAPRNEVEQVFRRCQIGDWFVLLLLGKNIDPLVYEEVICDLARRFEDKEPV